MRTDRSASEQSTSITTGTSGRDRLPCSMAFIVASATAVLSLSRRCSERPRSFTTSATLSIARRSFPGSLGTLSSARTRQVPLHTLCSARPGAVTIPPISGASPEVMSSSCFQTHPTKRLRRTYASCPLPPHQPRPHLPVYLSKRTLREPLVAFLIPLCAPVELLPTGRPGAPPHEQRYPCSSCMEAWESSRYPGVGSKDHDHRTDQNVQHRDSER